MATEDLMKKELHLPNIYSKIPQLGIAHNQNKINFNKISIGLQGENDNEERTGINYEGLRKKYLKSKCKK